MIYIGMVLVWEGRWFYCETSGGIGLKRHGDFVKAIRVL
jgi:hypothetical protein